MLKRVTSAIAAFLMGLAGGAVFYWLRIPLPWTLGSLSVAAVLSIRGAGVVMPHGARILALPVVGVIAGSAFTPQVLGAALQWWDAICAVLGFTIATTLIGYAFFRAVARFDGVTAFFASSPGGLGEMVLLGGTLGGDLRRLVLVHVMRIIVTVITIPLFLQILLGHPIGRVSPFASNGHAISLDDLAVLGVCGFAGYVLSKVARWPTGMMLFALLLSAAAHVTGLTQTVLPPWTNAMLQVVIGSIAGGRFAGIQWRELHRTLVLAVIWALTMVVIAAFFALFIALMFTRSFEAMLLALAPGGMVEMTTITFALGIDVAFVISCQVSRIILVVILVPLGYRLIARPSDLPRA